MEEAKAKHAGGAGAAPFRPPSQTALAAHLAAGLGRGAAWLERVPLKVRPIPFALAVALGLASLGGPAGPPAKNRSEALARALEAEGLLATERDVLWLGGGSAAMPHQSNARALVRAHTPGEPNDLWFVTTRLSPEGVLLDVGTTYNLTRSSGVDESLPLLDGRAALAVYSMSVDGIVSGVAALDLRGQAGRDLADFTRLQRFQTAVSNLQQTGQTAGVIRHAFALDPPAETVELSLLTERTPDGKPRAVATADGRRIAFDPESGVVIDGAAHVRASPFVRARPGNLITWSVDRVRQISWFGEEKMQVIKAIAFTGRDWLSRFGTKIVGDTGEKSVAEELGVKPMVAEKLLFTDPELGWPPGPIASIQTPPLPGEGRWISLEGDPFIAHLPGLPSPFVTTFLRPDKQRPQTRIYITLWDPRQVALHMEAGTVEPVSATGEAGPGVIPRTPEVMKRVVAGFNGGFQAMHGEFGMQASGVLYLPPKPYAATILEMKDGTTGFGSWGPSADVPDDVLSFRQNMTALIENGKHNPWGRTWWGGTPKGWADNIHTTRSAVCLTKESFVAYFWGHDTSAEALAAAMIAGGCSYAVHLDMNPGLAGFEFYTVVPEVSFTPLGRPLQSDWEVEGAIRDLPGFKYRARRMIKGMMHMNFPQYIQRDARDFFYLTLRNVLPGPALTTRAAAPAAGEGTWRVKGLPQHGFPYALATTWLRFDPAHPERRLRLLRVDPKAVRAAGTGGAEGAAAPTVLSVFGRRAKRGEVGLFHTHGFFVIGEPPPDAAPLAAGTALTGAPPTSGTFAGVQDEDGMLLWAELAPDVPRDGASLAAVDALFLQAGCSTRMAVVDGRALLGGAHDLADEPAPTPREPLAARLVRADAPGAKKVFDTPIVSPNVWQPLQAQRVRYFKKPSRPAPTGSAAGSATAAPAPSPPASKPGQP